MHSLIDLDLLYSSNIKGIDAVVLEALVMLSPSQACPRIVTIDGDSNIHTGTSDTI